MSSNSAQENAAHAEMESLYLSLCEAIFGHRKEVVASALTILLAEVCILGVSEDVGLKDAGLVTSALNENIRKLAFARLEVVSSAVN